MTEINEQLHKKHKISLSLLPKSGLQKHEKKETGKTEHEMPHNKTHKANQNKNNS